MADRVCSTCYRVTEDLGCVVRDDIEIDFVTEDCPLWLSAEKWIEINSEKEKS